MYKQSNCSSEHHYFSYILTFVPCPQVKSQRQIVPILLNLLTKMNGNVERLCAKLLKYSGGEMYEYSAQTFVFIVAIFKTYRRLAYGEMYVEHLHVLSRQIEPVERKHKVCGEWNYLMCQRSMHTGTKLQRARQTKSAFLSSRRSVWVGDDRLLSEIHPIARDPYKARHDGYSKALLWDYNNSTRPATDIPMTSCADSALPTTTRSMQSINQPLIGQRNVPFKNANSHEQNYVLFLTHLPSL